jgi:hypothetical protein
MCLAIVASAAFVMSLTAMVSRGLGHRQLAWSTASDDRLRLVSTILRNIKVRRAAVMHCQGGL